MDDELITPDAERIGSWPEAGAGADLPIDSAAADATVTAWVPGPSVRRHNGDPLPTNLVLFAPPPAAIGRVLSAHSSLMVGQRPGTWLSRLLFGAGLGSTAAVVLGLVEAPGPLQVLAGLAVFALSLVLTRFRHQLSYVGTEGVARLTCRGGPGQIQRTEQLVFRDAETLRTGQTRQYAKGVYTGTRYQFTWTDAAGRKLFKLQGTYRGENEPPKPKDPFHFAQAAEEAWTAHRWERLRQEPPADGIVRFPLQGQDWLGLEPGVLHVHRSGQTQPWPAAELGGMTAKDGVLKLRRTNAREGWFRSQGVEKLPMERVGNLQLFLRLAARWLHTP